MNKSYILLSHLDSAIQASIQWEPAGPPNQMRLAIELQVERGEEDTVTVTIGHAEAVTIAAWLIVAAGQIKGA